MLYIFARVVSVFRSYLSKLHSETSAVHKSTPLGYESKSISGPEGAHGKVGDQTEDLRFSRAKILAKEM